MQDRQDIVIIGSGMAGLSCARVLKAAGHKPLILDKGRGVGGRMATRRATLSEGEARFDHGAQYFTAKSPGFTAFLDEMQNAVGLWSDGAAHPHHVGRPGMSSLPRAMAAGLDLRQQIEVTSLIRETQGWRLETPEGGVTTKHLVLTIPAPQAARLIGVDHPFAPVLDSITMAPCLTLMAAFAPDAPRPFISRADDGQPLAWIAQDNTKPGRAGAPVTWVAQASADWSADHLEKDRDAIARMMLPLLCEAIGASPDHLLHAEAHRWRYARVIKALGQSFLRSEDGRLHLGGDWCIGPRVEAAWESGRAIAQDLLRR